MPRRCSVCVHKGSKNRPCHKVRNQRRERVCLPSLLSHCACFLCPETFGECLNARFSLYVSMEFSPKKGTKDGEREVVERLNYPAYCL